jgi:predicted RNA binding protein YcfA (HicA-like mRNA interferase family)
MKLPRITGERAIRALKKAGFEEVGVRGSHHSLYHAGRGANVTIPVHAAKPLAPQTLQTILFQAGLSVDEFRTLL